MAPGVELDVMCMDLLGEPLSLMLGLELLDDIDRGIVVNGVKALEVEMIVNVVGLLKPAVDDVAGGLEVGTFEEEEMALLL